MLENRWTIAATDRLHPDAAAELGSDAILRVLSAADMEEGGPVVKGIDALIVRRPVQAAWLDRCPDLRAMVRHGVGMDFLPVTAAEKRGVLCANTPGVNANAVAEYVLGSLLSWERRFEHFHRLTAEGQWSQRSEASAARELTGASLGIVGFGNIGRRVAEIATSGFRMQVAVHSRSTQNLTASVRAMSLQELFACCDYVVLCCPLTDETRHLVNRKLLSRANRDLVLVNVSRGLVVDEDALAAALTEGHLRGAILDVHTVQPLTAASPLFSHPKVMHTPHTAGITGPTESHTSRRAIRTALDLLQTSISNESSQ